MDEENRRELKDEECRSTVKERYYYDNSHIIDLDLNDSEQQEAILEF